MPISSFIFLIILIPNYATSLITFNFTNFSSSNSQYISLNGGASIFSAGEIQLTSENITSDQISSLSGRATYIAPLRLSQASFNTSFSFAIDYSNGSVNGTGLTFFLAQNNSVISGGEAMGLPFNTTPNASINPFVAVEFDTRDHYIYNTSAGGDHHVGINVNSLNSVRYRQWLTDIDIPNGREYEYRAWIEYNTTSKNLSVSYTGFRNNTVVREDGLYYTIDLSDVLPDWVIFGFSAAAASSFEKHNIKSWIFNSCDFGLEKYEPPNKTGILLGLAIGIIASLVILGFVVWKILKGLYFVL